MEESLYEVRDRVWFLEGGKAHQGTVMLVTAEPDTETWSYDVEDADGGITNLDEYEIFATPETLVRDIFEDFEIGEDIDIDIL